MSRCPNIDKDTLQALKQLQLPTDPSNRALLFYSLCIVARVFIAGVAYQYRDSYLLPYVTFALSFLIGYRLYTRLDGPFWWSRRFHFGICILLCLTSVLVYMKYIPGDYLSYLLYLDVTVGFLHSLVIERC